MNYYGLTGEEWIEVFEKEGISAFEKRNVSDKDIINLLIREVSGDLATSPILKQAGWSLNRFITAQKELGCDGKRLEEIIGRFVAIDNYGEIDSINEVQKYLFKEYALEEFREYGKIALVHYNKKIN